MPGTAAAFGSGLASGIFLLIVMGVAWGVTIPLSKIAVTAGAHPLGLTFWQGAIGGAFLLAITLLRRRPLHLDRQCLVFYVICGILGSVVPGSLLFWVAIYLPAGIIAIAIACVPLFTYALAAALRIELLESRRVMGVGLGLVSVALITLPETSLPEPGLAVWVLVALAACASYAVEDIYISLQRPGHLDALAATSGLLIMAAIIMLPLLAATDAWVPLGLPFATLEWSVVAMALSSAIAYSLFLYLIGVARPGLCQPDSLSGDACGRTLGHGALGRTPCPLDLGCLGGHDAGAAAGTAARSQQDLAGRLAARQGPRHPYVEGMGRLVSRIGKDTALEGRRGPAALHAFHHTAILLENLQPEFTIGAACLGVAVTYRLIADIKEIHALECTVRGQGIEPHRPNMIPMHARCRIGKERNTIRRDRYPHRSSRERQESSGRPPHHWAGRPGCPDRHRGLHP